jgi:hypothetical protein
MLIPDCETGQSTNRRWNRAGQFVAVQTPAAQVSSDDEWLQDKQQRTRKQVPPIVQSSRGSARSIDFWKDFWSGANTKQVKASSDDLMSARERTTK